MLNYGTSMMGSMIAERVNTLPSWSQSDIGRLLYVKDTKSYFLGAGSIDEGSKGWVAVGLVNKCIKSYHIDWDSNISNRYGAVSAKDIPVLYQAKANDVQTVISNFEKYFQDISNGRYIGYRVVKDYHLCITGLDAITANSIPIVNAKSLFPKDFTIEGALDYLINKQAHQIDLENSNRTDKFGFKLNIQATTVQDALEGLEHYLASLTAADIKCLYQGCNCATNVQFAIDALYQLLSQNGFVTLSDTPDVYSNNSFLKSTDDSVVYSQIESGMIQCSYPDNVQTTLDSALTVIENSIQNLTKKIGNLTAVDISYNYTGPDKKIYRSVSEILRYILNTYYNPFNYPNASAISCSPIGSTTNNNIQAVLNYLNTQFSQVTNQLACTNILSSNISYTRKNVTKNLEDTLNYILDFIDHMINNQNINFKQFN